MEDPKVRTLLELRKELDEELDRLRERIEKLEAFIQALDATIGVTSFATADAALGKQPDIVRPAPKAPAPSTPSEQPRSMLIMNKVRDLELATIEIKDHDLRIVPAPHASYDIKRGAFARFFVERILGLFQQEDRHRVESEEIEWDDAFDFEVRAEDGILQEVIIKNYGGESRLAEIERALRWALEKTYRAR